MIRDMEKTQELSLRLYKPQLACQMFKFMEGTITKRLACFGGKIAFL